MERFFLTLGLLGLENGSILTLLKRFTPPPEAQPSELYGWLSQAKDRYRWVKLPELDEIERADETAAHLLAEACGQGLAVHGLFSASYPSQLKGIRDSPVLLYTQGDTALLEQGIAIAGARQPTEQGLSVCDGIVEQVLACGFTVMASLERGIDSRVHQRSLALGGRTIAVLSCAHDQLATVRQRELAEAILAAGGCLVSRQLPGNGTSLSRLEAGHSLIGGLCRGMLLIEAIGPGGSEATLTFGRSRGRPLAFAYDRSQNVDEADLLSYAARLTKGRAEGLGSAQEVAGWLRRIAAAH